MTILGLLEHYQSKRHQIEHFTEEAIIAERFPLRGYWEKGMEPNPGLINIEYRTRLQYFFSCGLKKVTKEEERERERLLKEIAADLF